MQEGASTITSHALPGFLMPPLAQESFPDSKGSAFFSHLINQTISYQGHSQDGLEVKYNQQLDKVDPGFDWNAYTTQQSSSTHLNRLTMVDEQGRLTDAAESTFPVVEVALSAGGNTLPPAQQSLQTNVPLALSEPNRLREAGFTLKQPQSPGQQGLSAGPLSVTEQRVAAQMTTPGDGMRMPQMSLSNPTDSSETVDAGSLNRELNRQTGNKERFLGPQAAVQGAVASSLPEAGTRIETPLQGNNQAHSTAAMSGASVAHRQSTVPVVIPAPAEAIPSGMPVETVRAEAARQHSAESIVRSRQPGEPGPANAAGTAGVSVPLPASMMKAGQPEYTANTMHLSGGSQTSAGWEPGFRQIIPVGNPVNDATEPVAATQNAARIPESPQAQAYINQNSSQSVPTGLDHNPPGHSAPGLTADDANQPVFDAAKANNDLRTTAHEPARPVSQSTVLESLSSLGAGKVNDSLGEIGSTRSDTQRVPHFNLPVSVNHKAWSDAFSQRVQWLASNSVNQAEIRLDPPQLGKIDVQIDISGPETRVIFNVEHAQAKEALDNALPRLRDMMSESGFQQLDVGVGQGKGQAQSELAGRDSNRSPGTAPSTQDGGVEEQLAAEPASVTPGTIQDGVDIYA